MSNLHPEIFVDNLYLLVDYTNVTSPTISSIVKTASVALNYKGVQILANGT